MKYYTLTQSDAQGTAAQKAEMISREMYKMSRPNPHPDDVTLYLFGWVEHPVGNMAALEIDEDLDLPISPQANQTALMQMFSKAANPQAVAELNKKIDENKGKKVKVKDVLPANLWKFSESELKEMGFFPNIDK
jgi:hypothetical protein